MKHTPKKQSLFL